MANFLPVVVAAAADGAVGTFNGFVKASDGEENLGKFMLTATEAGKLTAKITTASGTCSFGGVCLDSMANGVYAEGLARAVDCVAAYAL